MSSKPRLEARQRNERPHVLIVSDDPSLTSFLEEGLPLGGFWTSVISNGLQAIEVFRLRQFDLIVVDLQLANFDGMELIRRLRGLSSRASDSVRTVAPLVVLSEQAITMEKKDQDALGIEGILVAPLELEDIVRTLHETFGRWREENPDAQLADALAMRADSR